MSELRTNRIVPRDGLTSATGKGGGVIQVVHSSTGTLMQQTTIDTHYDTNLSATITPTRADSKILIDIRLRVREDTGNNSTWYVGLKKTIGGVDSYPGGQYMMHNQSKDDNNQWGGYYQMVVDVNGGSSEITYTLAAGPWGSANGSSFNVNKSVGDGEKGGAQLIIYEVSG